MKNLILTRQDHNTPNIEALIAAKEQLEEILHSDISYTGAEGKDIIGKILAFQAEDGSFNLLDSYRIESDARVDFCHEPTYICSAILIRALLERADTPDRRIMMALKRALHMCTACRLAGHGYDGTSGMIRAVDYFITAGVKIFLEKFPDISPEFTHMFDEIRRYFNDRLQNADFRGAWGESYEKDIRRIAGYFSYTTVFVYGTLMKGQANHDYYLSDSQYIGEGSISGYEMYDLGSYPGIVRGDGTVPGELYRVSDGQIPELDRLEGEGYLYLKTGVTVTLEDGQKTEAIVYVYNHRTGKCPRITGKYGAVNDPGESEYVWYVSYGSNLLEERLKYYIEGGECCFNGRSYRPCSNRTLPVESRPVRIPFDMYYSNYDMGSWEKSAVSFLDLSRPGMAYGRAYKILRTQMEEIHVKEGKGANWYPDCIRLEDIEGLPAYTYAGYTVKQKKSFYRVSAEYGIVLYKGMKETYPEMSDAEILDYLRKCGDSCQGDGSI